MQNWDSYAKTSKLADGTVVFPLPINIKSKLYLVDVDDTGVIVRKVLENPDQYLGQMIYVVGEEIKFGDVPKVFTKVTGIPAVAKALTNEEFQQQIQWLPINAQHDLRAMYKFLEEYDPYDTTTTGIHGRNLVELNTFEQWMRKTGWKGD